MAEKAEQSKAPGSEAAAREVRRAKALKANLRRRKELPAAPKDED